MTELQPAPVDRLGIPLAIIPSENLPHIDSASSSSTGHHEFFLAGRERFRTFGGQTLRSSRVLRVEKEVHNHGPNMFHNFYSTSRGPIDEQGQSNILVLSLAGYYPKEGIDLWSGTPIIRELEDGEREILQTIDPNNELAYRNLRCDRAGTGEFLKKFVLKQDVTSADPRALEKFISTPKISHMKDEGYEILQSAIQAVATPIRKDYLAAKEEGLLHPLSPVNPETLIWNAMNAIGNGGHNQKLLRTLRESVLARKSLEVAQ